MLCIKLHVALPTEKPGVQLMVLEDSELRFGLWLDPRALTPLINALLQARDRLYREHPALAGTPAPRRRRRR